MITLDTRGQFVTTEGGQLGVFAFRTGRGRWIYRSATGVIYASGIEPAKFCKELWGRDDFRPQPDKLV